MLYALHQIAGILRHDLFIDIMFFVHYMTIFTFETLTLFLKYKY